MTEREYRLWVNADRTVLVRMWSSGKVEVCVRAGVGHVWKPPVRVEEERAA